MFEYVPGVFPVFALLELPFRSYVLSYVFAVFRVFALLELLAKNYRFCHGRFGGAVQSRGYGAKLLVCPYAVTDIFLEVPVGMGATRNYV